MVKQRLRGTAFVTLLGLGCMTSACKKNGGEKSGPAPSPTPAASPSTPVAAKPAPTVVSPSAPKSLGAIAVPKDNPLTAAKIALGKKLFFDTRLSVDGTRSCYSCHLNENGTAGALPKAIGAGNKQLTRNAPPMWNVAYAKALYWDGRAANLEAQALGAWKGGNMGVPEAELQAKADELGALPEYKDAFLEAFPTQGATPTTVVQAIASYERTLFCGETRYDKFANGDKSALSPEEQQGWEVFSAKGGCHSCHTPPFFSDAFIAEQGAYHNAGVGLEGVKPGEADVGRFAVTQSPSDQGAFKTPSLRNVSKTAPYFHDGSAATLKEAVTYMAKGGFKNEHLDMKFVDRKLTEAEVDAVVAFLGALECTEKLDAPAQAAAPAAASGTSAPAAASGSATPAPATSAPAAPTTGTAKSAPAAKSPPAKAPSASEK